MKTEVSPEHARFRQAAIALAALGGLLGLVGWASWPLRMPVLRSFGVGETGMAPLTGATVVLCAAAIIAAHRSARRMAVAGGLVAIAVGATVLIEWLLASAGGVAQLLVPVAQRGAFQGRVSVPAGVIFLLLGAGLVLVPSRRRHAGDALAIVALLGAFTEVTAYSYGARSFAPVLGAPHTGMALPTGIAMFALALSLLFVDAERGFVTILLADQPGGFIARRVVPFALLVPPALGLLLTVGRAIGLDELAQIALLTVMASAMGVLGVLLAAQRLNVAAAHRDEVARDLRNAEERLRMLFEHSTDGIFIAAKTGEYVEVNDAGCRMLRTSRDGIVGKTIADFIREEDLPRLEIERERVYSGALIIEAWKMRRGDGTWADIEVATRVLPDGRWLGMARDISQRKAQEEKLRLAHEAEQRLRRQIEAISDATAAVADAVNRLPQSDLRAVLHTVVLQAQSITGAEYGALGIGSDPTLPFDPWITIGVPEHVVRALGAGPRPRGLLAAVAIEGRCVRVDDVSAAAGFGGFPSGHPAITSLLAVPIRYREKSVGNLFLANKTDATPFTEDDQRALEILADRVAIALETARLYETEARERSWLQVTIDQMPEPVLLADATGRVTSWNRAASALAHDTLDGARAPFELRWPNGDALGPDADPLRRACVDGELVSGCELVAITHDGRSVPVLASASPLPRDEAHGGHGGVAILQDITQQKQLERLREEWTAIVAHDLRQPIASIGLAAQLLQRRRLPVDDAKIVERIRTGANRVQAMVGDLLDYAQIEAGRLRITPRHIDLKPLVADVLERLAPGTRGNPVRLLVEQIDTHAEVDPLRIDQVVTNLVSNAAKYGYTGTDIVVRIGGRDGDIELSVENRGPGLTQDELARLFARFARTKRAEATGVKGIGLGLFIAKGIVEAHGGRIWAESKPSETTTFHVVLPALPHRRAA